MKQNTARHSKQFILMLIACLSIFMLLSIYQIELPGLHYDEAFEAVPAMQLWLGQPITAFRDSVLSFGAYKLPLMTQDYIGAINVYAALPFIAGYGPTPEALRMMSIIIGAFTIIVTAQLGWRLSGQEWVGIIAALILVVEPTFIFWNRQGVFVTAVTALLGVAATYSWVNRVQGGPKYWSLTATFLWGVGLYAKFLFIWLIVASIGAIILLNLGWLKKHRHDLVKRLKKISPFEVMAAILTFLLGCWPLIVYNLQTGGTFLNIGQNASTSYYGVDNLAFSQNLAERLQQFGTLMKGSHFWYLGGVFSNYWPLLFFVIILLLISILAIRKHQIRTFHQNHSQSKNKLPPPLFSTTKVALFPFILIGLVILASIGTVSALWITHFAILMPWPALAIACGIWFIRQQCCQQSLILAEGSETKILQISSSSPYTLNSVYSQLYKFLLATGLGLLLITNLTQTLHYHRVLKLSGGLSSHSDAVYDLTGWLDEYAQGQVVAMDWGLAAPLIYLSKGRIQVTEVFGYAWQADIQLTKRLHQPLSQPDTLYLWRSPAEVIFDRSAEFKNLYHTLNLEENIEEAFYEKSGRPILGVTKLVEKGTASNPPQ